MCRHSINLFPHRISCSHTTWRFNDVLLLITNKRKLIINFQSITSCKAQTSNVSAPKQHDKLTHNLPSHQLNLISSSNIWRKLNKIRPSFDNLRYTLEKIIYAAYSISPQMWCIKKIKEWFARTQIYWQEFVNLSNAKNSV